MLTILLSLLAGLVCGTAGGGLVSWHLSQRESGGVAIDHDVVDPDVDRQIKLAANQWATAHGQPAVAALVAGKLRLAYVLSQRRARRRERWWSR
jgi:hypothetical protein